MKTIRNSRKNAKFSC
ncbi:hypothetical protein BC938DRAFT_477520 [Jimgerdemannia flammicorona]|uniref:Uncharacterized protein n=1 Tax=Jimgerdemannia flammicorona TaxID=994334 RepID=A0A433P9B5_9FUNG|nr:hypothetical protein BC938DRAFT_477520 [Jimgerdemannia flammicorona]